MVKEDDSGYRLTDPSEIARVLRSLQITRSLITIQFNQDQRIYSSLLIHTDMNRREFVIDELTPNDGNQRLISGEKFSLIAFYVGIRVVFRSKLSQEKSPEGFSRAFAIRFPQAITHKQRRDAYRATVTRALSAKTLLKSEARPEPIEGRVIDLSTTGIGCEFSHYIRPEIKNGEHFGLCEIAIDGDFLINCALIAKHPRYEKSSGLYYCGFEFVGLERSQQKQVNRYVLSLQIDARKIEARQPA